MKKRWDSPKKILLLLRLMLLPYLTYAQGATEKVSRSWDFTNWSEETIERLKVANIDGTEWSDIEKIGGTTTDIAKENCFWEVIAHGSTEGTTLSINNEPIKELEGLLFIHSKSRSLAIAVNYPSTSAGDYHGGSYLWLGSKAINYIVIPNVSPNTAITIGVESHNSTQARGLKLYVGRGDTGTELADYQGNPITPSMIYEEQTWYLPENLPDTPNADGTYDITIQNTNGCHVYFINLIEKSKYTLKVKKNLADAGIVTYTELHEKYLDGTEVTFNATANIGYEFVNWTNNSNDIISTSSDLIWTVTSNETITANFKYSNDYEDPYNNMIVWPCEALSSDGKVIDEGTLDLSGKSNSETLIVSDITYGEGITLPTRCQQKRVDIYGVTSPFVGDGSKSLIKWTGLESIYDLETAYNSGLYLEFKVKESNPDKYLSIKNIKMDATRCGTDIVRMNVKLLATTDNGSYTSDWLITEDNWSTIAEGIGTWATNWFLADGFCPSREKGTPEYTYSHPTDGCSHLTIPVPNDFPNNVRELKIHVCTYGFYPYSEENKHIALHNVCIEESKIDEDETKIPNSIQLETKDGQIITNGSTVTIKGEMVDMMMFGQLESNIYIRNLTEKSLGIYTELKAVSGSVNNCWGGSCSPVLEGKRDTSDIGYVNAGTSTSLLIASTITDSDYMNTIVSRTIELSVWTDDNQSNKITATITFTNDNHLFEEESFVLRYEIDGMEFYRDTLVQGESVIPLDSIPVKKGFTFSGWSEIPETMPAQDVTVTGTFTVNRYTLLYTLDGEEYSKDSIAYGTALVQKEALTKEGHTFSGWSELPETMPAQDVTVTGSFTVNRYTLLYTLDGEEYSKDSIAYGTALVQKEALTKEGHTFSGWSELPETMPAQDVTVTGSFTVNRYTLLYTLDGEEYSKDSIAYGTALVQKETLTKEGHTFSGWSELPETMPAQDVTVTGSFTVNRYTLLYTLDGEEYSKDSIAYGTALVQKEALTKEGHTFGGWSELPETMPAQDVTVTGTFTVNRYTLSYMLDGEEYSKDSIAYGTALVQKEALTKEGHTFSGWSEMPETMPAQDVTVTGTFMVNRYRLTYTLDGTEYSVDSIAYGTTLVQKEALTKEGHTFSGWSEMPETMPAGDVTVTGTFTVNRYTLLYTLDGEEYSKDSIAYGTALVQKEALTKEGYTFSGWSELPETMPAQDVTVTGTFMVNRYRLTYTLDETEYSVDSIAYGTALVQKESLTKEGHTFSGWSEIPETMPAQDVTVTGSFTVNRYTLSYMLDGEECSKDSIAYGTALVQKEALTKEGHTFSGWSELPEIMPARDVTVTGTFTVNKYLLSFVLDGDTIAADSVTYGATVTVPEATEKKGYTFSGWGEVATTMPAQDLAYTANYILNEEQTDEQGLTYLLNGAKDAFAVSGYTDGLVADVTVPETLYGLPVTALLNGALEDAEELQTLVLPTCVTGVGEDALSGCHNLLVVEWNATAPLLAECFDGAEAYGNMLVFATKEASSISFDGNVVVDGVAEEIVLTDGMPFRNPKDFTAEHISYSREFTKKTKVGISAGWEGIVLPFDVQSISHEEKGALAPFGSTEEGLPCWMAEWQRSGATFVQTPKNMANQPFIMEVPNSDDYEEEFNIEGMVTFAAEDVTVYATTDMQQTNANGYSLQGTYEGVSADSRVYALNEEEYTAAQHEVYMPGGVFVANARDIRPFEAYVHNAQVTRSRYLPVQGGKANGMDFILLNSEAKKVDVYSLQGILVRKQIPIKRLEKELPQGIYIVDGKKVVVK